MGNLWVTASDQDGPFYHGTNADLEPGDEIKSAKELGHPGNHDYGEFDSRRSRVWLTRKPSSAGFWGDWAAGGQQGPKDGAGHVYEVTPHGPVFPHPEIDHDPMLPRSLNEDQAHAQRATVIRRLPREEVEPW